LTIHIYPDVGRNILFLELSGEPTLDDVEPGHLQMTNTLARLRMPFDVVSDISALISLSSVPEEALVKMALRMQGKVHRVVRIVGRSSVAAIQLERLSRIMRHSAHLAFSREEALGLLTLPKVP
jgi:hypothetical protein